MSSANLLAHLTDAASTPAGFYFWNDFIDQDAVDATVDGQMTFSALGAGTFADAGKVGGWGRLGDGGDDGAGGGLQALGGFACTTGKRIVFKTRVQFAQDATSLAGVGVALESEFYIGLYPVDTSVNVGEATDTDCIIFKKIEGTLEFTMEVKSNSATETFIGTVPSVSGTGNFNWTLAATTLGIAVHPNGTSSNVFFFVNGKLAAKATGIAIPASTVLLTPTVMFLSGEGTGIKYLDIDYVGAYQDR
jgi:hypothetical protein